MQIFFIFASCLLAPTFISGATILKQPGAKCNAVCTTASCTKEAEFFRKYMDFTAEPCDDFYQFVCGNYVKNVPIPKGKGKVSHFHTINDKIRKQLISQLKATIQPSDLKAIKNVKIYYQNCLDEDAIEKVGDAPLVKLIDELGGWPVLRGNAWNEKDYKWQDTMSNISNHGFLPEFPVKLSVVFDPLNSSNYILGIKPAVTIIDESYSINGSKSLEAYETLMIEIAVLLGATRENATAELKECSKFEFELYQLKSRVSNIVESDDIQTVKTLSDKNPDMPWLDIFNNSILNPSNVNINENEILSIVDPPFMSKIKELIEKTPKRVLANYQIWRVIYQLIDYLPRSYRNQKLNFYGAPFGLSFNELQSLFQRDEDCFDWVQRLFETAIGAMYVKRYFDEKSKDRANEMIQYMREEFESTLHKVQWMDGTTRKNALEKLQALKFIDPDELADDTKIENIYKDLEITPGDSVEGYRRVSNLTKNLNLNKLRKTVDETEWISETNVADANAVNDLEKNEIRILAGILQEPFFKFDRPDYLNYGAIGHFVGHEIIHGFDSTGRKFDKFGNYNNWWDKNTTDEFEKRVKCLIDQFDGYVIKQINRTVDGNRTRDENIADGGGVKLAYHAYRKFLKSTFKTEQCLPNINYSPQQMFWISAASTWCGKSTDEVLLSFLSGEHSPFEARINVGFSNIQEFSDDFKCPLGSKMNPINKCIVW